MTKLVDIETYYRPDDHLTDLVAKHLYHIRDINGHRFTAAFLTGIDEVDRFIANHDHIVGDFTFSELTDRCSHYKGKSRYVFIGISLSQITYELYLKLNKKRYWDFETKEYIGRTDLTETINSNIKIHSPTGTYYWVGPKPMTPPVEEKPTPVQLTTVERGFVDSLKGFDFYYEYTDDSRVYNAAKNRERALISEGMKNGLSESRCNELFKLAMKAKV